MPAHRTQNARNLRVEANSTTGAPQLNVISPTPQTFVFSSAMNVPNSGTAPTLPFPEASRSLPNLFTTFHASPNGDYSSYSPTGSQTSSMFTSYVDSPVSGASTSSFFASPSSSAYSSSPGSPSNSPCPSPSNEGEYRRARSTSASSAAPYPLPQLEPRSNGQARTQPPRPPNPWICYRNFRSQQYKEQNYPDFFKGDGRGRSAPSSPSTVIMGLDGDNVRRPRQADLSKHISLEWKALSDEERAPFIRMSEEAKIEHARKYPGYKYQPRRKPDASAKKNDSKDKRSSSSPTKRSPSKSKAPARQVFQDEDEELCQLNIINQPMLIADEDQVDLTLASFSMAEMNVDASSSSAEQHEGAVTQEIVAGGGDPEKDWTWLPDETLIPISWEPDQDLADGVLADMANPVGADENEEESEFKKPICLPFNLFSNATATLQNNPASFGPVTAEPESDHAMFAMSNFDFTGSSLGFHFDGFGDMMSISMDDFSDSEQRRDSISSVGSYEGSDCGVLFAPLTDGMNALGFTTGNIMMDDAASFPGTHSFDNSQSLESAPASNLTAANSSPPRRSPTPSLRIDTTNIPVFRPPLSPRRASISSETVFKSPDGMLCPPVMGHRRSKTLGSRSAFPSMTGNDIRSIPTETFGSNSGVMTSVLIPNSIAGKRIDPELEMRMQQDLKGLEGFEDYSRKVMQVSATDGLTRPSSSSSRKEKNKGKGRLLVSAPAPREREREHGQEARSGEAEFDTNAEFDAFEAEFGEYISMDPPRGARPVSA